MSEKDGKKRKRQSTTVETPNKKASINGSTAAAIKVKLLQGDGLHPVLASSPGLMAPAISFDGYTKPLPTKKVADGLPKPTSHQVLLHSSKHPRLDYTASPSTADAGLSHYVAVFDPSANALRIVPAHHVDLRAAVRAEVQETQDQARRTIGQQRELLGREFGTKKAKKAIASKTENAITKGYGDTGKNADVQNAILESVADTAGAAPKQEDEDDAMLAAKPIPKPNTSASTVEEVYPLGTLIPSGDLRTIPIKEWQEKARAGAEIQSHYQFAATRVPWVGKDEDSSRLKALAYLTLLLDFHAVLQNAGRSGKKVPKKDVLSKKMAEWPAQLVDSVRRRFSDAQNELNKWHMDNLYTHICALSLFIDNWTTETSDLKVDLRMENKQMSQYFHELGCKVGGLTEKERESRKATKAQAAAMRMAKLKLPLEFPKVRAGRRR